MPIFERSFEGFLLFTKHTLDSVPDISGAKLSLLAAAPPLQFQHVILHNPTLKTGGLQLGVSILIRRQYHLMLFLV